MRDFIGEDFLLSSNTAKKLFFEHAKDMPIFDYHCHVSVEEIANDKKYQSITELWLGGDHYKWRAMRLFGIDEEYITGGKSDFEKFQAYASMIECAIGNPLYHWTHLELQRYFGINQPLNSKNAKEIYCAANAGLENLSVRNLIKMSNVRCICSTDDPTDSLNFHAALKNEGYEVDVLPTFRPDKAVDIEKPTFVDYIKTLSKVAGMEIQSLDNLLLALEKRIDFFVENGCKLADHALSYVPYQKTTKGAADEIFQRRMEGGVLQSQEIDGYKTFILQFCAAQYHKNNMAMQIHIGATRNNNTEMFEKLGADSGFDGIDDNKIAANLSRFLDSAAKTGLPKTILYNLNPKDNYVLAAMMGNFPDSKVATKVQFGAAWWFNDNRDGIKKQLGDFASLGMLAKFVGMLTDSRSYTSYVRHEYFRRILCDFIGEQVENGELHSDFETLGKITRDISYNNIVEYFNK